MRVEVRAFATLRRDYMPDLPVGEARVLDVEPGTTLADVMRTLGLPAEEVKVIMRNHRQAELADLVQEGDRVAFLPAVAGG